MIAEGAYVSMVSSKKGNIGAMHGTEWSKNMAVDKTLDDVSVNDFDALLLPGGGLNPDTLRTNDKAVSIVRQFSEDNKPIAVICHRPYTLVEADVVKGKKILELNGLMKKLM